MTTGRANRGFTLIELLMVIAIIGLLASIIIGSMRTARLSALDASIREQVGQLRTVLELERSDSGTYTAIKTGGAWRDYGEACSGFTGSHAAQADAICEKLTQSMQGCAADCLYFRQTSPDSPTSFSIVAYLPGASAKAGKATYLCLGSSGAQSLPADPLDFSLAGCTQNP